MTRTTSHKPLAEPPPASVNPHAKAELREAEATLNRAGGALQSVREARERAAEAHLAAAGKVEAAATKARQAAAAAAADTGGSGVHVVSAAAYSGQMVQGVQYEGREGSLTLATRALGVARSEVEGAAALLADYDEQAVPEAERALARAEARCVLAQADEQVRAEAAWRFAADRLVPLFEQLPGQLAKAAEALEACLAEIGLMRSATGEQVDTSHLALAMPPVLINVARASTWGGALQDRPALAAWARKHFSAEAAE